LVEHPTASALRQAVKRGLAVALPRRSFLVRGAPESRTVCLTFDDGPHPAHTPRLLDALREHDVTATFFVIGARAAAYPQLARRIVDEGHCLGSHSYYHRPPEHTSPLALAAELARTRRELLNITGSSPRLFRPPRGQVSAAKLLRVLASGHTLVLWSLDPRDYASADTLEVQGFFAVNPPGAGDIVLMHDIHPHAARLLPGLVASTRARGLDLCSVDRMLRG
jgi:peptidoglycan/xylan/chitin deacetylase (PgdA/CDA1 family)